MAVLDIFRVMSREQIGTIGLALLSLITLIVTFVPFTPEIYASEIDASWIFALNQAVAQSLRFGTDIIFTFGPYAAIYSQSYHPATDSMMLWGSLYLALSYWITLMWLMRGVRGYWLIVLCGVLSGMMYSRDALLFSLPLLLGLLTFKVLTLPTDEIKQFKLRDIILLFAPLGLLPLIKGSILILCGITVILCALLFMEHKQRQFAIACVLTPFIAMLGFWVAIGQALGDLPAYFLNMLPIISGYSNAMSDTGDPYEIILYLISAGAFLFVIARTTQFSQTSRIFLASFYAAFLFIAFKAGFVRHSGHELTSGVALLLAACFLPFVINTRMIAVPLLCSCLTWLYIDTNNTDASTSSIFFNMKQTYSYAWDGLTNRLQDSKWAQTNFENSLRALHEKAPFPELQGSTDIYSYHQLHFLASKNTWSPRPIFQSYSVYTPALAEANKAHLSGINAPDNIIFGMDPIDQHLPALEDGASWSVLLANYQPVRGILGHFLILRKRANLENEGENVFMSSKSTLHTLGEKVQLPPSDYPVFAQLEIKPSVLGRLVSILFKLSPLEIKVELENGQVKPYRMIAGMAEAGFIISPLVENYKNFAQLYEKDISKANTVKSIQITARETGLALWQTEYIMTLGQVRTH